MTCTHYSMHFIDLSLTNKPYEHDVKEAINRVLSSGVFIGGDEVEQFEQAFATYLGVKHVISCANGTDALFLSLKALGIGAGDEVIVPSFTYVATASTVAHTGATPVFCDVDARTFSIDPTSAKAKITANTKAIIPVHLFGQSADMDAVLALATEHNLFIIEDAAQSTGATWNGKQTGSMGTIGCFSFFPTKNLGGYGDGGALSTNDNTLAEQLRMLKHQGQTEKYHHVLLGHNSRLDSLQAAMLRAKLPYLQDDINKRREQAAHYNATITDATIPYCNERAVHTYNQYTLITNDREAYQQQLNEKGIPSMVYYPLPLHLQPCFAHLGYSKGDLPVSEQLSNTVLSLPILT